MTHPIPLLLITAACVATAQEAAVPTAGTPEKTAHDQLEALRTADWQKFTAHMHPKSLARFKELMLPVAAAVSKSDAAPAQKVRKAVFADIPMERLEASAPEIFFERFMQNFAALNPGLSEAYKTTTPAYLGQIKEGAIVHVLARYTRQAAGEKVSEVTVASFEQEGGVWKALLSSELEQLAARLRAQFLKPQ
jgi:hypothetical protein